MNPKRDFALDVMRGLALVLMVQIHSLLHVRPSDPTVLSIMSSLGALAAPFFLICAGMGTGYFQQRNHDAPRDLRSMLFRRGFFLIVLTSLLGLSHLDIAQIFDWDIFTVIGVLYVLLALIGDVSFAATVAGIALVLLANLVLPIGVPTLLRDGSFPIIPFAVYFLVGLGIAKMQDRFNNTRFAAIALGVASAAVLIAILVHGGYVFSIKRYDVWTIEAVVAISSLFLTLWIVLLVVHKRWKIVESLSMPLVRLGRLSFSLYYVQYAVLILVPTILERLFRHEVFFELPVLLWFVALLVFLALLYLIVILWARYDFKMSLEWFMHNYISRRSQFADLGRG